jgi:hypothetical protein
MKKQIFFAILIGLLAGGVMLAAANNDKPITSIAAPAKPAPAPDALPVDNFAAPVPEKSLPLASKATDLHEIASTAPAPIKQPRSTAASAFALPVFPVQPDTSVPAPAPPAPAVWVSPLQGWLYTGSITLEGKPAAILQDPKDNQSLTLKEGAAVQGGIVTTVTTDYVRVTFGRHIQDLARAASRIASATPTTAAALPTTAVAGAAATPNAGRRNSPNFSGADNTQRIAQFRQWQAYQSSALQAQQAQANRAAAAASRRGRTYVPGQSQ